MTIESEKIGIGEPCIKASVRDWPLLVAVRLIGLRKGVGGFYHGPHARGNGINDN